MGFDKGKNPYDRYVIPIVLTILVAAVIIWALIDPVVWHRLHDDFWPADRSFIGPNIVASLVQWVVIAVVASVIYPPLRHAIATFIAHHVEDIKAHVSKEHAKAKAERDKLHKKMDAVLKSHQEHGELLQHIIKNSPDIPDFPAKTTPKPRKTTAKLPKEQEN